MSEEGAAPAAEAVEKSPSLREIREGVPPLKTDMGSAEPAPPPEAPEAEKPAEEPVAEPTITEEEAETLAGDLSPPPDEETVKVGESTISRAALVKLLSGDDADEILGAIKRTVRANGEDVEVSLLDALESVPKAKGWQKRMYDAAQSEKTLDGIARSMGSDVVGAYAKLHGCTVEQAKEAVLAQLEQQYARDGMTPEDRTKHDAQVELERKAAAHDTIKAEQSTAEDLKAQKAFEKKVRPQMFTALKEAGVPKSGRALQQMAGIVAAMHDQGLIDGEATPENFIDAAKIVAEERVEAHSARFDGLEGAALLKEAGPELSRKIAKAVAKAWQRTARAPATPPGTETPAVRAAAASEGESVREWKNRANKRMGH